MRTRRPIGQKVDLEALHQHLINMNEVTLKADATPAQIDGGLEMAITGSGRTLSRLGQDRLVGDAQQGKRPRYHAGCGHATPAGPTRRCV
jgi:hypothetical protein